MRNFIRCAVITACLLSGTNANASTWQVLDFKILGFDQKPLYGFVDGQPTQTQNVVYNGVSYLDRQWLAVMGTGDPLLGPGNIDYSPGNIIGGFYFGFAPVVDTTNHTIDLSGLLWAQLSAVANVGVGYYDGWIYKTISLYSLSPYAYGYSCTPNQYGGQNCGYGYTYGEPVTYVDLADGSKAVFWQTFDPVNNSSYSLTMRFSEVPVPAAAWLLGSGLVALMGVARRKVI